MSGYDPALVERAAEALAAHFGDEVDDADRESARAALDAVADYIRAEALVEAAADLDQFADDTYPEDIFRRPTSEDYAEINALLKRERGHMLDGVAADCYSHAISVQAARLRERAAEIREDAP